MDQHPAFQQTKTSRREHGGVRSAVEIVFVEKWVNSAFTCTHMYTVVAIYIEYFTKAIFELIKVNGFLFLRINLDSEI